MITSRDPAVSEVAAGAAIHTETAAEIAQAMCAVAADPNLRRTLSEAGLIRARSFSWTRTARETHAIYAEVLHAPTPDPA